MAHGGTCRVLLDLYYSRCLLHDKNIKNCMRIGYGLSGEASCLQTPEMWYTDYQDKLSLRDCIWIRDNLQGKTVYFFLYQSDKSYLNSFSDLSGTFVISARLFPR